MSLKDAKRVIEAGGIVPATSMGNTRDNLDTVTARTYVHPGLEGRLVVRLVPATLGPAEDLAMEFLGLTPAGVPVDVGTGRRQALGFPSWAIVNDPANGHHALALVKDVERLTRLARTKPGVAKDGFEKLAGRLGTSVPHFLPTFYEQAGRAFLEADNALSAALMFSRARESEKFHGLAIDEDRRREVFLEFAFAGALAVKSLTQYARELASRANPSEAYEMFLHLCVERVAGGLPPYVGMAQDLRRLAKGAGLDAASEDERVLSGILESPSLAGAPLAFWKAYAPVMVRLAKADDLVLARLLDMFPSSELEGIDTMWFDLLDATGAAEGLVSHEGQAGVALPRGGASAWLERAAQWRGRGWGSPNRSVAMLGLVARMAPRLRSESKVLDLGLKRYRWMDLDLLDLCLSLDLEIRVPEDLDRLELFTWLRDTAPGRRDLAAIAAAAWASEALINGMNTVLPSLRRDDAPLTEAVTADRVRPLLEDACGREFMAWWLRRLADDAESAALPGLEQAFEWLAPAALDVLLALEPDAAARLASVDCGRALARTLRMGLFDELGWPALETAVAEFPEKKATSPHSRWVPPPFRVEHSWPVLMLVDKARVIVVGAQGVLLRHDMRAEALLPSSDGSSVSLFWCDGQLLVSWLPAFGRCGYWSDKPSEVFDMAGNSLYGASLPIPGGGRTGGARPIMPGDKKFSGYQRVAGDGTSWWRWEGEDWREFDVQTGNPGRLSRPAFFEAALATGEGTLVDHLCFLAPTPPELARSPLGTEVGALGWRVVLRPDGSKVGESVDGAVVRLSKEQVRHFVRASPEGALQFPGGHLRVAVLTHDKYLSLWDGQVVGSHFAHYDKDHPYARGTAMVPPVAWWHALQPRDLKGSIALRSVTDDQGQALIAAATAQEASAAVRQVLPEVTDPRLIAGLAGVVEIAVACARNARALPVPVPCQTTTAPVSPEEAVSDAVLAAALSGLNSVTGRHRGGYVGINPVSGASALPALRAAVALVEGSPEALAARSRLAGEAVQPGPLVRTEVEWSVVIGGLGAIALRAASASTTDEHRNALVRLLEALVDTPLVETDGRWREVTLLITAGAGHLEAGTVLSTSAGAAVVLDSTNHWNGTTDDLVVKALEHAPSGTFGAVAGYTVQASRVTSGWGGATRVRELLALLRARGPAPWRPEAVAALVTATGMTHAEAAVLLAGLPRAGEVDRNFLPKHTLPKHTREILGLKVTEAAAALSALSKFSPASRMHLAGLAMPERPADLWDHGPNVKTLADTWVRSLGRRADLPEEILGELSSAMEANPWPSLSALSILQGFTDPESCSWLTTDRRWSFVGGQIHASGEQRGFDGGVLVAATSALLWLAYRLPSESSFRAGLARTYELLQQRLKNPDLLVATVRSSDLGALRQAYGHPPAPLAPGQLTQGQLAPGQPAGPVELGKAGLIVHDHWGEQLWVRPASLKGWDDPLLKAAGSSPDPETAALRLLFDPALGRLVESLKDTSGGWAQDPLVSAPALVPLAQEALGVDADAGRLYLQLLALPDPKDKNILRWNGWSPPQLKKATAALLSVGALVGGKRPRAGRATFLPCAWLEVEAPMPPIEVWKVGLLGLLPDGRGPLGFTVPSVPLGELFTEAWERVSGGDGPRYEQVEMGRR